MQVCQYWLTYRDPDFVDLDQAWEYRNQISVNRIAEGISESTDLPFAGDSAGLGGIREFLICVDRDAMLICIACN